ncbi:hypothetical protein TNCV_2956161 [Trichonephila clavipes]|nr:hypothetical protein TNCV_2956161 [Trichonephila clavipes]
MLAKNFKKYFLNEDSLVASYEWIRDLFQHTPEGLSTTEEEIFIDLTSSEKLKGVTSLMVVNSHLSIHNRFYGFTSWSRTSSTSSIVPAFLRSTSCGMTSARGHGAIVYCLNSGSEERQTGRHNSKV